MTFTLLPAVDVANGQAVRPIQGKLADRPFESDPLEAAIGWQKAGAEWIHLVDLDAAFDRGSNADLLASIINELEVPVQLSGGIADDASLDRALSTSCSRVVLATTALEDLAWCSQTIADHGQRIAVALDVRISAVDEDQPDYQLIARGSSQRTGPDLWETLDQLDRVGCARYVVTDVTRDGMLSGPNLALYQSVVAATSTPIIASGGVSKLNDLRQLAKLASDTNLEGAIVGKALYVGRFTLGEALATTAAETQS